MKNLKKLAIIIVTIIFMFSFVVACQNADNQNDTSTTSSTKTELKPGSAHSAGSQGQPQSTPDDTTNSEESYLSSNNSGKPDTPPTTATDYADRMNVYFNSALNIDAKYVGDTAFIQKILDIGEYKDNAEISSDAIYASPNGNGEGTFISPYSLQEALDSVKAGQTLYLLGGTYDAKSMDGYFITCKGNASGYITIRNYPSQKVKITNSYVGKEAYGLQIDQGACYFVLEGIEIGNITSLCAYGVACWGNGQNHFILRNNHIHDIKTNTPDPEKDTEMGANGILIYGEKTGQSGAVKNVAFIGNELNDCVTGWCECLSVTANAENVYIFENYVHDNTNIGIDFNGNLGGGATAGTEFDQPRYSIACGNRIENSVCGYAECAGLYCDGARDILFEYNIVTKSQFGIEIGSEEKVEAYPVKNITVRNNIVANNLVTGIRVGGYEQNATGVVYGVKVYNNTLVNNCSSTKGDAEIVIAKVDGVEIINNIVLEDKNIVLVKSDFNENYTKNVTIRSNLFSVKNIDKQELEFGMYAKVQMGFQAFDSLFAANFYEQITLNADYSLPANSPAVNKGENIDSGLADFYLKTRKVGNIDLGAVEFQS